MSVRLDGKVQVVKMHFSVFYSIGNFISHTIKNASVWVHTMLYKKERRGVHE